MAKDFAEIERMEAEAGLQATDGELTSEAKQSLTSRFVAQWEKKNARRAIRGGVVSTMALTLAACGDDDDDPDDSDPDTTPTAQTFTLTTGTDDFTGGAGDDSVTGARVDDVQTLNTTDTVSLGDGTDALTANLNAGTVSPTISGVETLTFTGLGAGTVDFDNVTGATTLAVSNSTAAVTLDDIQALAAMKVSNQSDNATFVFKDAVLSGSSDEVTLTVDAVSGGEITIGSEAVGDGDIETVNVVVSSDSAFDPDFGEDAATVKITGSGDLDINGNAEFENLTTFNASAATGDIDVTLADRVAANFDGTEDLSVTTGSGDDDVDIDALTDAEVDNITVDLGGGADRLVADDTNTDSGNSLSGGAGQDTIQIDAASTSAFAGVISNFEILEFNMGGDISQDMDLADGMNIINVFDTTNDDDLNITDAADGLVINLNGANISDNGLAILDVDLKANTTADDLTVNLADSGGGVTLSDFLPDTNYETVTVDSAGTAANTLGDISTALNNINITGATDLTVTGTGSLTGVVGAADFTGDLTLTTDITALTVNSGSGADSITTGAATASQTINAGAGNDTLTAGAIVGTEDGSVVFTFNGEAGSDTINLAAATFATDNTTEDVALEVNGGAGIDFITLDGVADDVTADVNSDVVATANADIIDAFATGEDQIAYSGALSNGANTQANIAAQQSDAANLATAIGADDNNVLYQITGNLTGDAATELDALADTSNATTAAAEAEDFLTALAATLNDVTGLDSAFGTDESVLLIFDDNTDSAAVRFTNTTATGNDIDASELNLVAVADGAILADGDFIA